MISGLPQQATRNGNGQNDKERLVRTLQTTIYKYVP